MGRALSGLLRHSPTDPRRFRAEQAGQEPPEARPAYSGAFQSTMLNADDRSPGDSPASLASAKVFTMAPSARARPPAAPKRRGDPWVYR